MSKAEDSYHPTENASQSSYNIHYCVRGLQGSSRAVVCTDNLQGKGTRTNVNSRDDHKLESSQFTCLIPALWFNANWIRHSQNKQYRSVKKLFQTKLDWDTSIRVSLGYWTPSLLRTMVKTPEDVLNHMRKRFNRNLASLYPSHNIFELPFSLEHSVTLLLKGFRQSFIEKDWKIAVNRQYQPQ